MTSKKMSPYDAACRAAEAHMPGWTYQLAKPGPTPLVLNPDIVVGPTLEQLKGATPIDSIARLPRKGPVQRAVLMHNGKIVGCSG